MFMTLLPSHWVQYLGRLTDLLALLVTLDVPGTVTAPLELGDSRGLDGHAVHPALLGEGTLSFGPPAGCVQGSRPNLHSGL